MVVHRRRRQLGCELALPSGHIASRHDRDAIVAVRLGEDLPEPLQVQRDLGRHLLRAHSGDGQRLIALGPRGDAVGHRLEHAGHRPRVLS
jgi:hypothetical protein